MAKPNTIVEQYDVARWEVPGLPAVTFPVLHIEERGGNRIVGHARVYRDGERLDDTGGQAIIYTVTTAFFNSPNHEEGVDGLTQFPDNCNRMIEACTIHHTGTLTVPWKGPRRCRAESYQRVETPEKVDLAACVFVFKEDNEDDAAAAALVSPSAQSVAHKYATDATGATEGAGATSEDLASLASLASDLQDLARAPAAYAADIEARAGNLAAAAERVGKAFSDTAQEASSELVTLLTDPSNSRAHRLLARLQDAAHRMKLEPHGHLGRVVTRSYDIDLSIFDVATRHQQRSEDLIALNAQLPDLLRIPRGTRVRILG